MEAVGLGVGVVGLAGLFSACIDCFELVQRGRYHGKDYLLLETKFANQRLRLITWGRACGFQDADQSCDDQFADEVRASLETTLIQLITLLNDGRALRSKYGLKHDQPPRNLLAIGSASINALVPINFTSKTKLGQRLQELKDSVYKTQNNAKFTNKARWAIEDKSKFAELVQHLKDLIDDLESLTRWLSISERQREIIQCEVESISDVAILETMEAARLGRIDAVSDAASVRLWDLRDRFLEDTLGESPPLTNRLSAPSVHSIESEWEEMTYDANAHPKTAGTCYQVLHRVVCAQEPSSIFLDAPSYNTRSGNDDQWVMLHEEYPMIYAKSMHLSGRRPVPDLEAYLRQNRQLSFVVFKTYSCCQGAARVKDHLAKNISQSIYLCSEELCVELKETFKVFLKPEQLPKFRPGSELRAPYFWFYHSKDYVDLDDPDAFGRKPAVQALLEFISKQMSKEYSCVDAMIYEETVSWKYLSYLFVPGEFVCEANIADERYYQAHEVIASEMECDERGEACFFAITVLTWEYDGKLRPNQSSFRIARTQLGHTDEGTIPLSNLPVICLAKNYELQAYLLQRGRIFWNCRYRQIRNYSGPVADSDDTFSNRRFMIDPDMYYQLNSKRVGSDNVQNQHNLNNIAITPGVIGSDDFLLRLPHTTWAYDLEEHCWRNLFVSGIAQVAWARESFSHLVLPQRTKDLLLAMASSPNERGDINPSRTGQLLLLHGAPGTGKTLVAETMAEMTERPLYRIRGSNIGTDATKLEENFRAISHMCNEWGCVVLLDDADVFLERRKVADLQRNSLFLIFLRCLDYFTGTIILTTTRVGAFDETILSRCQLVVHLPSLDDASRKLIWRNLIETAKSDDIVDSNQLDDMVDDIMEASQGMILNGLEIRNMVKMAKLLARSQDSSLSRRHFIAVMRNSRDFSKYLHQINGVVDVGRDMDSR